MSKRITPNEPCIVLFAYRIKKLHKCVHCNKQTDIQIECWFDTNYLMELLDRGLSTEKANLLAVAASIRHQQKDDSKPYHLSYLCMNHLTAITKQFVGRISVKTVHVLLSHFNTENKLIVFDENDDDNSTKPVLIVASVDDIKDFLQTFKETKRQK